MECQSSFKFEVGSAFAIMRAGELKSTNNKFQIAVETELQMSVADLSRDICQLFRIFSNCQLDKKSWRFHQNIGPFLQTG